MSLLSLFLNGRCRVNLVAASVPLGSLCALLGCSEPGPISLGRAPTGEAGHGGSPVFARDAGETQPSGSGGLDSGAGMLNGGSGYVFDTVRLVAELAEAREENPTLTWDLLEIYFSSRRSGAVELWWARRSSSDAPFENPQMLDFGSAERKTSPAIEGDGRVLWFAQRLAEGTGALDIFRVTRPLGAANWSEPQPVAELNSERDDIPRPTGAGGLIMPLSSRRGGDSYRTYAAPRRGVSEPFAEPVLLAELVQGNGSDEVGYADAYLSADGLVMFYTAALSDDAGDLYVATRAEPDAPFLSPEPVASLNTEADERDPWLSPDGTLLFFVSDRDGERSIYQAQRVSTGAP